MRDGSMACSANFSNFFLKKRLLLLLFLYFSVSASVVLPYDVSDAKYAIDFAGAAYCSGSLGVGVHNWSCYSCVNHPNVVNVTVISKQSLLYDFNAFVAYDVDENNVVVSIAGTDPLKLRDFIDDLDFLMVDYDLCDGCKVHQGFLSAFKLAADEIKEVIESTMDALQLLIFRRRDSRFVSPLCSRLW